MADGTVHCIDSEIPFDIPDSWAWCRLGHILNIARGGSPRPIKEYITTEANGINWIKIGDTEKGGKYIWRTKEKIKPAGLQKSRYVKVGDFLLTNSMSFGRPYILKTDGCIHDGWLVLSPIGLAYNQDFLYNLLSSQFAFEQFSGKVSGAVVQNLNSDKVASALFPIPPYNEQRRIAEFVERIEPYIDTFSSAQISLASLNKGFNKKMKKSILQEAIQGRLVPQIASEGTAEELLTEIRAEKERLVKEGKLKKSALTNESRIFRGEDNRYYEKIGSTVAEIELPFKYPSSWSIVKLSCICQLIDGQKTAGKYCLLDAKYLRGKSIGNIVGQGKFVKKDDNIILVDGENSGEVFTVPQDGYMGSTFKQLWISSTMYKPFVLSFILFYKDVLRNSKRGAAIPHLNKDLFNNLIIGIPPFEEQKRIVQKINALSEILK